MTTFAVLVVTSARYLWALRPFAYLFNIYWSDSQPVIVVSDARPDFALPPNFEVRIIGNGKPIPAERWTDGLIEALEWLDDTHTVIMLEDYWLVRRVDALGVSYLVNFMAQITQAAVLRMDLTADRQYNGYAKNVGYLGHYDLVETPGESEYQMSLQAGIWNVNLLLGLLKPGMSPWDVELQLSPLLHDREDLRVLGTRQCPIRYINAFKSGQEFELQQLDQLPAHHREELESYGWLSPASPPS